ncbi:protein FAR-RED ELONGATED HYPOCOTYL 3-like [Pyrus ussuriensis x Pyrus communis]|uniref:Protein FAR-RED ELONGATED HYPOCOTYL 3-like n=1 Tax=Pyrus ussuriensis x Pyrus communis TaxID=2448454 RepID=A0A5N5H051_9ROSA|nr:protein FAR-RED ELONGATED HYPOCOTYL 3-like [Pyrus ussuriensis x Pyrus communis]
MEHRFDTRPRPWLDLIGNDSKSTGAPETSAERDLNAVVEPHFGMEFESEDAAEELYEDYSRRVGFIMSIDQCRRSDVDKRVLSQDQVLSVRRPQHTTRECCKAMMLVKLDKSGKWVVTRVVKDHAHPLIISSGNSMDTEDMKIAELTMDLGCEEQLSMKVRGVVNYVREFETDVEGLPQNQMEAIVRGLPPNQTVTESGHN